MEFYENRTEFVSLAGRDPQAATIHGDLSWRCWRNGPVSRSSAGEDGRRTDVTASLPKIPDPDIDRDQAGEYQRHRKPRFCAGTLRRLPRSGLALDGRPLERGDVIGRLGVRLGGNLRRHADGAHFPVIALVNQ